MAARSEKRCWSNGDTVPVELLPLEQQEQHQQHQPTTIPLSLWQRTYDEYVHQFYPRQKKHRDALAFRRQHINRMPGLPLVVLISMCLKHQFREEEGDTLWRAWIIVIIIVPLLRTIAGLLQQYYVKPAYRGIVSEWNMLADNLQREYDSYGVTVRVQRATEVLSDLTDIVPNGQLPCGLILEAGTRNNDADRGAVAVLLPDELVTAGVPAALWQATVDECAQLHADQSQQIQIAMDNTMAFVDHLFAAAPLALFVTIPLWTWWLGWTANRQMVYIAYGWACWCGLCVLGMICYMRFGSKVGPLVRECDDEWRSVAARTEPHYTVYALVVTIQTRPIVPPDRLKGFFDGPAARVVGLSFRTTDGNPDEDTILCTIEDGNVVVPPPAAVVVVVADESSSAESQSMQVPLIQMT
jgi:hypothetical protein